MQVGLILLSGACTDYDLSEIQEGGEALPILDVQPPSIQFGTTQPDDDQIARVEITNLGDALLIATPRLEVETVTVLGWQEGIAPDETVVVDVVWDASAGLQSTLWVESNDGDAAVELSGNIGAGGLAVAPDPVDFGWVAVGDSALGEAEVVNNGEAALELHDVLVEGEGFALTSSLELPTTLDAGESLPLTLSFAPVSEAPHSGVVWATADVGTASSTLTGNSEDDVSEVPDDECHQPEFEYDKHPEARLVVDDVGDLVATFEGSDAGYTNELWLDSTLIAVGHSTAVGTETALSASVGDELKFRMHVRDTGDDFWIGDASRNADGFTHSAVTYLGDCTYRVGFEDTWGGGDQDFDDIVMVVKGDVRMEW